MILLASTMDGLDLSRSRVMVAAVQSLAFYCFPLLTGLLLHVMRQRDHDSYLLRRQHERGETARSLHDTIGNDLAYLILRIDHAETDGMPADEHEYQQQLDELRDAASRAMGHTHEVIDSLEEHTPAQASRTPNKPTGSWRPSFPLPACYRQWNGDVRVPVVGIIGDVERPGHGFDNGSVSLEAAAESEPYRFVL